MLSLIMWSLIWGGMFSGPWNIRPEMFSEFGAFLQGGRALLPVFVLYVCLIWMIVARIKIPNFSTTVGLFFFYCLIGLALSFFSPSILVALYWGAAYLSPIVFFWLVQNKEKSLVDLRRIAYINYVLSILIVISLFPQTAQWEMSSRGRIAVYELPLGIGFIRGNGAARFALIVLIFALVRFITMKKLPRYFFLILIIPSLRVLMQSQSRTALLGLAVAGLFFVVLLGLKWQFLFIGPGAAYLIYLVGFKWRAQSDISLAVDLTGRELTWSQAIDMVKQSPIFGWGFHADRILLESQHMHNSYLHALIQSGIIGFLFFVGAFASIWYYVYKNEILKKVRGSESADRPFLLESLMILGALTARSFFESTAAFFGVDLLFFITAAVYIYVWGKKQQLAEEES